MEAAAVSVAHGAMGSLIKKLGDLLIAEHKLLKEAKGQILFLKAELESMYVFLKKISDAEQPDEQDKHWAKEVRELSYDIEDSVNEFMLRVQHDSSKPQGFKGFISRSMKLLTTMNIRHDIAKKFEGLKVRVEQVRERRMRYQLTEDAASRPTNTTIDLRLSAMYAEASSLVGLDGPRDELIQLMDGEDELKVISIVGFGGLGKTTLANEIYRKLPGAFQCRAFVSVSQKPNIRKLLKIMLSQVGYVAPMGTNMELWEDTEFIGTLREFLTEKRYFIVIDDIWHASDWDSIIRYALPENNNGSKVLITTRIETVGRGCCIKNIECVYKMKALSDQDSRSLFFKRIFGSEEACPPNLNEVSAQILKKCGGLPLAIITISSLIASQPSQQKDYWENVRDCLGSSFEMSPSLEVMRQIMNLSYINLPHYLKTCMLYLGLYPEDYTIGKNVLARQWVAEGFIYKSPGRDIEDTAKSYFNELINRSLIQPAETRCNGEVMSCRVHDMMLDFILHKSREENFVTVIDDIKEMTEHQDKIRRLSLNLDGAVSGSVPGCTQLSQTRTLAIFGTSSYLPPFQMFKYLRVLTVQITVRSGRLLLDFTEICHLFQLRSLKIIAEGHTVVLPRKIGSMQELETFQINAAIKLSKGQSFDELPSDIVSLSRLLHLILPGKILLPNRIGNMKSLRTLHWFNVRNSSNSIKGLGELTNLTNIRIVYDHPEMAKDETIDKVREVLEICLGKLCNLKYLYVVPLSFFKTILYLDALSSTPASFSCLQIFNGQRFTRVPGWIIQLHNLYDLYLTVKQVFEEDVGILAQLSSVINLALNIEGTPEDKIIICAGGFPVLKRFAFSSSRISCLAFVAGAMPKLERLVLGFNAKGWDRYGAAPTGTEHLSGLREIYVNIGGSGARESNRRAAVSALRTAIDMHPGRPVANIECDNAEYLFYEREKPEEDVSGGGT